MFLFVGFLGLLLQHALENFRHVVDGVEHGPGDVNRTLLLQGQDDGIAGPRVELDDLLAQLVFHPQQDGFDFQLERQEQRNDAVVDLASGTRLLDRIGQTVLTCPTTACFDGLPDAPDRVPVGGVLRHFGDRFQSSKFIDGKRYWRIPVMEGEFLIQEAFGMQKAIGGGNLLILAEHHAAALAAAEAAVEAMRSVHGIILPFPGGIVRSGSKVGSRYKALRASTNDAYCPTLRGVVKSELPEGAGAVYEIVIDGIDLASVETAMKAGIPAACRPGVLTITAGNYGGKLGPFHLYLHKLVRSP